MRRIRSLFLALAIAAPLAAAAQVAPAPAAPPAVPQAPAVPPPPATSQGPAAPEAPAAAEAPAEPQEPRDFEIFQTSGREAVRIFRDFRLPAGEAVRDATVVLGDATIAGRVDGDLTVVLGNVNLVGSAVVRGSLVAVGGQVLVQPGGTVERDLVVVGGGFEAPPDFSPGGEYVVIGAGPFGESLAGLRPYLASGLVWGRLIVPGISWIWSIVAAFLLLYLAINAVFDRPVRACATTLAARPMTAFGVGLLVLLLIGPVFLLLAVSVIGIAVVPFLALALVGGWIVGKVGVARWMGTSVAAEEEDNRLHAVRSVLIGFALITIAYMVPVIGLVTWAITGTLGLGAATLAFVSAYRTENPKPAPDRTSGSWWRRGTPGPVAATPAGTPPDIPPPPVPTTYSADESTAAVPPPPSSGAPDSPPAMAYQTTVDSGGAAAAAMPWPDAPTPSPGVLAAMPKALFRDRLAAFVLDILLIVVTVNLLGGDPDEMFPVIFLAYFVASWTWKGTTIGGYVCNLRVVRTDGAPLSLADALIRGLAGVVSLAVFFVGALWMLRDPESQTWHDKVAGTYVVKVPRT